MTKPPASPNTTRNSGYGKPPQEHRFKPGQSGNPHGRPRKSHADTGGMQSAYCDAVTKIANEKITLINNGKSKRVTSTEAVFRLVRKLALQGSPQAIAHFLREVRIAEQRRGRERLKRYTTLSNYKRRSAEKIHQSEVMGNEPFTPCPHPDDMLIDTRQERIVFNGLADDVEQGLWNKADVDRREVEHNIDYLEKAVVGSYKGSKPKQYSRKNLLMQIETSKAKLAMLDSWFPTQRQRRRPGFDLQHWRKQNWKGKEPPEF